MRAILVTNEELLLFDPLFYYNFWVSQVWGVELMNVNDTEDGIKHFFFSMRE